MQEGLLVAVLRTQVAEARGLGRDELFDERLARRGDLAVDGKEVGETVAPAATQAAARPRTLGGRLPAPDHKCPGR